MGRNVASEWMSVPEAALLKGVAESSVRAAIQTGRLMGAKVGRSYIVRRRDVEAWRPGPRGPKRARPGVGGSQASSPPAVPDAMPEQQSHPTREEILAFLEAGPLEQQRLLRETTPPGMESPFQKALRLRAAVSDFAHRGISTEEHFRDKRAEIELEQRRADARDA
jgi:excisionase family DNA binding protein